MRERERAGAATSLPRSCGQQPVAGEATQLVCVSYSRTCDRTAAVTPTLKMRVEFRTRYSITVHDHSVKERKKQKKTIKLNELPEAEGQD